MKSCSNSARLSYLFIFIIQSRIKKTVFLRELMKNSKKDYQKQYRMEEYAHLHDQMWLKNHPEYHKKWRENHPDYAKKKSRKWRKKHPDYAKEYAKKWREEHPDYYKKYRKKKRRSLRKYWREYKQKRRRHAP